MENAYSSYDNLECDASIQTEFGNGNWIYWEESDRYISAEQSDMDTVPLCE